MSEELLSGLSLMVIGMITVFIILALIVILGNLLISVVNRFFPEHTISPVTEVSQGGMDPRKVAAIVSAVDIVTEGKGKVTSITRE